MTDLEKTQKLFNWVADEKGDLTGLFDWNGTIFRWRIKVFKNGSCTLYRAVDFENGDKKKERKAGKFPTLDEAKIEPLIRLRRSAEALKKLFDS